MPKLHYLFVLWDGGGAVSAQLSLIAKLKRKEHQVSVLGELSMQAEVESYGCTFYAYQYAPSRLDRKPASDPYPDWNGGSPFTILEKILFTYASAYAKDVLNVVQQQTFDEVVVDGFLLGGLIGAQASGLPFHAAWPALDLIPHPGRPPDGLGFKPARHLVQQLRNACLNSIFLGILKMKGKKKINALRDSFGLPRLSNPFDQYLEAKTVFQLASRHFDFPCRLPVNYRYLGPQLDDPSWSRSAGPYMFPESPIILVSLGSSYQQQKALYQKIIDSLEVLDLPTVVTLGKVFDIGDLQVRTDKIQIVDSVPHKEILPHCRLVINHGGHGIVMKSVMAGVPQVVLPLGRDQFGNAARVDYWQLGKGGSAKLSVRQLVKLIQATLEESARWKRNALEMSVKIKKEMEAVHYL